MRVPAVLFLILLTHPLSGQDWSAMNKQGLAHYNKGEYPKAAEYLSKAVALSSQAYGQKSEEHTIALTNYAYVKQAQGDFRAAQDIFRKTVRICASLYDSIHIDEIEATANLANAFLPSGDYDSCEFYLQQARQLIGNAVQQRSLHYSQNIHLFFDALVNVQASLASLLFKKGQIKNAISLLSQQRIYIQQTYPDDYQSLPIYINTLHNLATYYFANEDLPNATIVVKEQVTIAEKKRKKEPLKYFDALSNLGNVYRQRGELDSAMLIWKKVLEMTNNGIATGSDRHVSLLSNIGELELARDNTTAAVANLSTAASIQEKRAAVNPRIYQTTLLNLADSYHWNKSYQQADETYSKLTSLLIDEVLHNFTYLSDAEKISFYRNNTSILEYFSWFAFDVSGTMKTATSVDHYTTQDALKRLFDLRLLTKGLVLHPGYRLKNLIASNTNSAIKSKYDAWETAKYTYANLRRSDTLDITRLSSLSQQMESLEKWLRTNSPEFRNGFVIERKTWQDIQKKLLPGEAAIELVRLADGMIYGALILTPSTTNGPAVAFVKGSEKLHLEKQFYTQYANAITHSTTDTISYSVYWDPIVKVVRQNIPPELPIKKIYLSADGIYHQISLNTLFNPGSQRFVLEETDLRQVTNLKDILQEVATPTVPSSAVLVGRPAFQTASSSKNLFTDLPCTEAEVNEISAMLVQKKCVTTVLKNNDAQESSIKKLRSPAILHFATHGFFISQGRDADFTDLLLNAGIALAGANGGNGANGEDGILTAYEMMNVDLERTKLVVLSACETGLGTFYSGEGVYGLQRALRSAGAKAVIMSLWKVDDEATQNLMSSFYRIWLNDPGDPRAAFRKAQQELKTKFQDPRHWGAFVYLE